MSENSLTTVPSKDNLHKTELDVATARAILRDITQASEEAFGDINEMNTVAGHNIEEMQAAFAIAAVDAITNHDGTASKGRRAAHHVYPDGRWFDFDVFQVYGEKSEETIKPEKLSMNTVGKGEGVTMQMPLIQTTNPADTPLFAPSASYGGRSVYLRTDQNHTITLSQAKHIWRSYRWCAANILNWGERYISMADLDSNQLASGETPQLTDTNK